MNGFNIRKNIGQKLQDDVVEYLNENNINYILSGYEHLTGSGHRNIKKNNDKTSIFIRHYPDISLVYNDLSFLLEIKNSTGIEKECYYNYLSLKRSLGLDVLLYLKNKKVCKIEDLKLKKIKSFDSVSSMEIPITDDVWKEPRLMDEMKYYEYLDAYRNIGRVTSGCSFAYIDFKNTPFYERNVLLKPEDIVSNNTICKTLNKSTLLDF